jgi:hypothetical protein
MKETFTTIIDGREYEFEIHPDSYIGWWCVVPGMYEPGSVYGAHSMKSREDAALQLVEKIENQ